MEPKILIDDGRCDTRLMLAAMMGMALSQPGMMPRYSRPIKQWTWSVDNKSYARTEERKARIKDMRRKKRARKSKRGY